MDVRELAKVALRVLSVYILAQALIVLPGLLDVAVEGTPQGGIPYGPLWLTLAMVIPFVVGLLVWILAARIARWIGAAEEGSTATSPLTADTLQVLAFVTLGVLFVVKELPQAAAILYEAAFFKDAGYVLLRGEDFFVALVGTVLGMALILGSRFWMQLIRRWRA